MKKSLYVFGSLVVVFAMPILAFAQFGKTRTLFEEIASIVGDILVPLVFGLAVLFFLWGIAKYIWSAGSDAKKDGKQIMVWGVIGLTVMVSVWGIVKFIQSDILGENVPTNIPIPTIGEAGADLPI